MSPGLVAELSALLQQAPEMAETALRQRLAALDGAPPLAELVELGSRARSRGATPEELALAVGTLLSLHAPPAATAGP